MGKRKAREEASPELEEPATASPSEEESSLVPSSSNQSNSSSDLGGSESDSEVDSPLLSPSSQDVVNVDFEFFDPKPVDFHGTKALLKTYLDDVDWDINGFVELFLAQTTVGSVVKTSEEESPIGIITAFNLARYQDLLCMKEVHQYLQKRSSEKPEFKRLEKSWGKDAKDVGLIVSERLINIPIELIPPLYDGLFEEIMWATEDEPTQDLRNSFNFKYYLVLTKIFEEVPKRLKASDKNQNQVDTKDRKDLIFIKPEDEIFLQLSSWSFTFPMKSEAAAAHETMKTRQLRLVMGIEVQQVSVFTSRLKALAE